MGVRVPDTRVIAEVASMVPDLDATQQAKNITD